MATSTLTWLALLVSILSSTVCTSVSQPFNFAPVPAPAMAPATDYGLVYDSTPPIEGDISASIPGATPAVAAAGNVTSGNPQPILVNTINPVNASGAVAPVSDAAVAPVTAPTEPQPALPVNPLPATPNGTIGTGRRLSAATCGTDKTGPFGYCSGTGNFCCPTGYKGCCSSSGQNQCCPLSGANLNSNPNSNQNANPCPANQVYGKCSSAAYCCPKPYNVCCMNGSPSCQLSCNTCNGGTSFAHTCKICNFEAWTPFCCPSGHYASCGFTGTSECNETPQCPPNGGTVVNGVANAGSNALQTGAKTLNNAGDVVAKGLNLPGSG